ncbi:ArgE/DapE family deacylase [Limnochorda pilosa]|uniref:Acetylornithine deacetylase n=1 Tax=Limnochorda pilosa TaxID=1555112 RepID=A0A0K2SM43_LIMPI|nr:ArgE/DapE family deacylase [Limnochorda pilosa]BAS28170.1 acetylornithine deacetylase [Limnochorda pilosa]
MDQNRIRQAVAETREEAVALLRELIRIDTQAVDHGLDGREGNATAWLEGQMKVLGCSVDVFEPDNARLAGYRDYTPGHSYQGRPNVVGRLPGRGGGRSLILNTHIDVVPPGDESAWRHPPFSGTVADGRVYGRGTSDTKSGMAVSLHALRILRQLGFEPRGEVIIEGVVDEEGGGNGTLACVDRGYTADGAICFEPTEGAVAIAHRGVLSLRIRVAGEAGHAATKWRRGVSAIEKAMRLVRRLNELEHGWLAHKVDPYLPAPTITVGKMAGGIGPTTVPQACVLEVDVKYLPSEVDEAGLGGRVKAEVEAALLQEAQADPWLREHPPAFEWYVDVPPSALEPDHPFAVAAAETLRGATGQGTLGGFPAGCDARILSGAGKTPSIIYGPGSLLEAHAVDESVTIDAYLQAIEFVAQLIARWTA